MSFSGEVRDEIMDYYNKKIDPYIIKAERFGEYLTQAQYKNDLMEDFSDYFNISNLSEDEIKAVIKGVLMASGCIIDPNKDYRFEASFKNKACAEYFIDVLSLLDFTPKLVRRAKANVYVVYFKESEQISYMLSLLEANKCMLKFEEIRVVKDVNNTKNRATNCEVANMTKSINSSLLQLSAINVIRKKGMFLKLNDKLKYTASLREQYPTDTLEQIASKTEGKNKISKSGLKHRLDKLIEIAQNLQSE